MPYSRRDDDLFIRTQMEIQLDVGQVGLYLDACGPFLPIEDYTLDQCIWIDLEVARILRSSLEEGGLRRIAGCCSNIDRGRHCSVTNQLSAVETWNGFQARISHCGLQRRSRWSKIITIGHVQRTSVITESRLVEGDLLGWVNLGIVGWLKGAAPLVRRIDLVPSPEVVFHLRRPLIKRTDCWANTFGLIHAYSILTEKGPHRWYPI